MVKIDIDKLNKELEKDMRELEENKMMPKKYKSIEELNKNLEKDLKNFEKKDKKLKKALKNKNIYDYLQKDLSKLNPSIEALPIKYGREKVIEVKIKADKMKNYKKDKYEYENRFTKKEIREEGNKLSKKLQEQGFEGFITTSLEFNEYWRNGRLTDIGMDIDLYEQGEYDKDEIFF